MDLTADRAGLTERWYREGFYGAETIADHLRLGAEAFPHTAMHFVGGPNPASITPGRDVPPEPRVSPAGSPASESGPVTSSRSGSRTGSRVRSPIRRRLMLGATVVPIIHIYGPHEVGFILRQSGARVLVMPGSLAQHRVPGALRRAHRHARARTRRTRRHRPGRRAAPGRSRGSVWPRTPPSRALPATHPDDRCLLIYTSGTTADPKGVQHTTNTLIAEIRSTARALGERRGVNLAAFPSGHIAGVLGLLRMFVLGTSSVRDGRVGRGARRPSSSPSTASPPRPAPPSTCRR